LVICGLHTLAAGWLLSAGFLLSGCAAPAEHADKMASGFGFHRDLVAGKPFRHVIYRNLPHGRADVLHVYIEGDGSPFERPTVVATDPTSRDLLMLRLMSQDASPSIYLGRPCYFGRRADPECNSGEWTSRRFAPEVLDSMESVLRAEITRSGASRAELFGHSGGGTLAVLLAQRVGNVDRAVTIAPTLDIVAWCALHGYTPLTGSINPVDSKPRPGLAVIHWVGEKDTNTPPFLVETAARSRGDSVHLVAGFDHRCCWRRIWRDILEDSAAREP
jgi:hypothetical protein